MERPERIVLFWVGAFTDRMAAVMWVLLVLSIITVANRIHYTYLALNGKPIPTGNNLLTRGVLARVLLARRAGHAALRPVGDRHPVVHLADAAGLAARSNGDRPGCLGLVLMDAAATATETAYALEAMRAFGPVLAIKLYRIALDDPPAVPTLPCLDHEAMLHAGVPPHAAAYVQDSTSGDLHELVFVPAKKRIEIETMSTWQEQAEDSRVRLRAHLTQRFPGHGVRVTRGRSSAATAAWPMPAARR